MFFHRFFDRFSGGNFRRFFERFPGVFYRRFRTFFSGFKRLYIDVYFEKYSPFFKHCYGSISEAYFAWKIATKKSFCVAENRFFFEVFGVENYVVMILTFTCIFFFSLT